MLQRCLAHMKRASNKVSFSSLLQSKSHRPRICRNSSEFLPEVFEVEEQGIVCYTDENGEVICEGYDEGPRFTQQHSDDYSDQR